MIILKSNFLFNAIAPIYSLFFKKQRGWFLDAVKIAEGIVNLKKFETALDVGCGTGAFCSVLDDLGLSTTGIDTASTMIEIAKRKNRGRDINFIHIDADSPLPFDDNSFDIVTSSFVLHGLQKPERYFLYREMNRVSKNYVIIHDYNDERALLTSIIEYLEGGDYFNFIKFAKSEMEEVFSEVEIINVGVRTSWYICKPTYLE